LNFSVNLQCCDFLEYSTENKYDLFIIPSSSFLLITDNNKISQCLNKLKELCNTGAKIIIEIELKNNVHYKETDDIRVKYRNSRVIIKTSISKNLKPGNTIEYFLNYKLYERNISIYMITEKMRKKYYVRNEFKKYIANARLKIEDRYIDYRKTRYNKEKNGRVIFIIN